MYIVMLRCVTLEAIVFKAKHILGKSLILCASFYASFWISGALNKVLYEDSPTSNLSPFYLPL